MIIVATMIALHMIAVFSNVSVAFAKNNANGRQAR